MGACNGSKTCTFDGGWPVKLPPPKTPITTPMHNPDKTSIAFFMNVAFWSQVNHHFWVELAAEFPSAFPMLVPPTLTSEAAPSLSPLWTIGVVSG